MEQRNLKKLTWIGKFELCKKLKDELVVEEDKEKIDDLVYLASLPRVEFEDVWGVYSSDAAYSILSKCKSDYAKKSMDKVKKYFVGLGLENSLDSIYNFIG